MKTFRDFFHLFTEGTALGTTEIRKPNSKTGEDRISILRRLINTKEPLELAKGGTVIVTDIVGAMETIDQFEKDGKNFKLKTNYGDIKLTQLKKSEVFGGGGGGAGGGTAQTKNVESAQCLWCAAMLDAGSNMPFDYFTDKVLKASSKNISVDAKMEDMLNISDSWKMSAYLTAQHLIDNKYISKGMMFHRGDNLMGAIYKAKNQTYKNQGFKAITDDKWNPGDIWASKSKFNPKVLDTSSIRGLQKSILDLYVKRDLVGISLKLVKKKAKSKEYNIQLPPDVDDYRILKFGAKAIKSGRGDFWSSKGGVVVYDDGSLTIKDNSAYGTIKAEISGKTARGGGAGWGYITLAATQSFGKIKMPGPKDIANMARKIAKGDKKELKKMYDIVNVVEPMSYEDFETNIKQKDGVWIHAKYGVCIFLHPIAKFGGKKADRYITKIVNYAGSKTEDSSAYIKVYE